MLDANLSPFAFVGRGHQFAVGFPCFLVGLGSFLDVWTECTLMFVGFWERGGMEEGKLFLVTMAAAASSGAGAPAVPAAMEPVTLGKVGVWVKLGELLLIHCSAELATRE